MRGLLSVMTYNICDGGDGRLALIRQVIADARVDVILVNEADNEAMTAELANDLGMNLIWARGSGQKHIGFLSRLPIVRWEIYNRRPITQAMLVVEIETTTGERVDIYGAHLLPYFMLLPYELARWRAVSAMLGVIQPHAHVPHLVMGDFNAVAAGEPVDLTIFPRKIRRLMLLQANRMAHLTLRPLLRAGYTDAYRVLNPERPGRTWVPNHLSARLDYIFADEQLSERLRECEVYATPPADRASDHYPLVARFALQ